MSVTMGIPFRPRQRRCGLALSQVATWLGDLGYWNGGDRRGYPAGSWRKGMRGVVFVGERELEIREFPDLTPGPGEVIVAIKASGMCGSDLHSYREPKS